MPLQKFSRAFLGEGWAHTLPHLCCLFLEGVGSSHTRATEELAVDGSFQLNSVFLVPGLCATLPAVAIRAVGCFGDSSLPSPPQAHIESLEGIVPEDQVILLGGTPLEDDAVIGQCGISDLTTLEVAARMLGGKVHGSLARAGKVRGQTPKVAKQEKKKKKTGRAKRRMQYNRRFVNIVPGFGKKKGPNANS
uniref:FAU ubiquitin like and ribosomal protein S30 fusion n=1 Tax=Podarcis muralis TaxID=64176 RepID=A0A670JJX6_PODMU